MTDITEADRDIAARVHEALRAAGHRMDVSEKRAQTRIWSPLGEYRVTVEMGMQQLAGIIDLLRGGSWETESRWHKYLADALESGIEWVEVTESTEQEQT